MSTFTISPFTIEGRAVEGARQSRPEGEAADQRTADKFENVYREEGPADDGVEERASSAEGESSIEPSGAKASSLSAFDADENAALDPTDIAPAEATETAADPFAAIASEANGVQRRPSADFPSEAKPGEKDGAQKALGAAMSSSDETLRDGAPSQTASAEISADRTTSSSDAGIRLESARAEETASSDEATMLVEKGGVATATESAPADDVAPHQTISTGEATDQKVQAPAPTEPQAQTSDAPLKAAPGGEETAELRADAASTSEERGDGYRRAEKEGAAGETSDRGAGDDRSAPRQASAEDRPATGGASSDATSSRVEPTLAAGGVVVSAAAGQTAAEVSAASSTVVVAASSAPSDAPAQSVAADTVASATAGTPAAPTGQTAPAPAAPSVAAALVDAASAAVSAAAADGSGDAFVVADETPSPQTTAAPLGSGAVSASAAPTATPAAVAASVAPPVVAQIAAAIISQPDQQRIELRLDPAELGSVEIQLSFEKDGVKVMLFAERDEALDLMRRQIDALTKELEEAGLDLLDLTFASTDDREGGAFAHADDPATAAQDEMIEQIALSVDDVAGRLQSARLNAGGLDLRL